MGALTKSPAVGWEPNSFLTMMRQKKTSKTRGMLTTPRRCFGCWAKVVAEEVVLGEESRVVVVDVPEVDNVSGKDEASVVVILHMIT